MGTFIRVVVVQRNQVLLLVRQSKNTSVLTTLAIHKDGKAWVTCPHEAVDRYLDVLGISGLGELRVSPDGKEAVYVVYVDGSFDLWNRLYDWQGMYSKAAGSALFYEFKKQFGFGPPQSAVFVDFKGEKPVVKPLPGKQFPPGIPVDADVSAAFAKVDFKP